MKTNFFFSGKTLFFLLLSASLLMSVLSCKKTKDPENMQLMGAWLQSTDQDSIYLYVDKIGGSLYITSVIASVHYAKGGSVRYVKNSSSGLADISSNTFDIILETDGPDGPVHLNGIFNPTSMVCSGTFAYYQYGAVMRSYFPYTISRP